MVECTNFPLDEEDCKRCKEYPCHLVRWGRWKMSCPFKAERHRYENSNKKDNAGFSKLKTINYIGCKLMGNEFDECVGEDKCPIMKK